MIKRVSGILRLILLAAVGISAALPFCKIHTGNGVYEISRPLSSAFLNFYMPFYGIALFVFPALTVLYGFFAARLEKKNKNWMYWLSRIYYILLLPGIFSRVQITAVTARADYAVVLSMPALFIVMGILFSFASMPAAKQEWRLSAIYSAFAFYALSVQMLLDAPFLGHTPAIGFWVVYTIVIALGVVHLARWNWQK